MVDPLHAEVWLNTERSLLMATSHDPPMRLWGRAGDVEWANHVHARYEALLRFVEAACWVDDNMKLDKRNAQSHDMWAQLRAARRALIAIKYEG